MDNDKLKMQSPDLTAQNIEKIAALFPDCVTEGKIDFDLLRQQLQHGVVDGNKERYRLEWPGKREAIVTANLPTTNTLRPVREDSVDFDNTENLYIEGDNLEVLKLLQESYLGKIKMIYIAPPYNTGKDFIYRDNFTADRKKELLASGQIDDLGQRLVVNPETAGRYHSDWLSMMYPRLKLARNLLTGDGVIFISIDDNEVHNLRKLCDEIFGEVNFVTNFVWEKKKKPSFLHKNVGTIIDYIICYVKDNLRTFPFSVDVTEEGKKYPLNNAGNSLAKLTFPPEAVHFDIQDSCIQPQDMSEGNIITKLLTKVVIKNGLNENEFTLEGEWRYSQKKINEIIENNETLVINRIPFRPNHIKSGNELKKMKNCFSAVHYEMETNEDATAQLINLFGIDIFDNPKPVKLIKTMMKSVTYSDKNSLILDFFAGSATTAHAVMQLNAEDGGNRKFIMVQLPETIDEKSEAGKAGYKNICEIGKERIRRAGKKIAEEKTKASGNKFDTGFRVYCLDTTNMQDVYYRPQDYRQENMELFADNIKFDRTTDDLLAQVMLDWGLPLSLRIEQLHIAGKEVFRVAGNSLYACFDTDIDEAFASAAAKDKPLRIVFRDSGFKDDTAKTNVKQLLKQLSPETEMKVI
jgi:adenine-specific DNA-methyltransferase